MQYLGGKSAIAKDIAEVIKSRHSKRDLLIEPFMGGGAMTAALAPLFKRVQAYDIHPDLIAMWSALKDGWVPPDTINEKDYNLLKISKPSPVRGFAGFGASYGGKWFGGFARSNNRDHANESKRGLLRDIQLMQNVSFKNLDFSKLDVPKGAVIYADPPYSGTTSYTNVFSSFRFWFFARKWVEAGAIVYVSEYRAPHDFTVIWENTFHGKMKAKQVTEKLFTFKD